MIRRGWAIRLCLAVAMALLPPAGALAASCSVSSSGLSFGPYDPFAPGALDGAGDIAVQCDADTAYSIALGPGSGSYAARQMPGAGTALAYNLFVAASRLAVWGDGSAGTSLVSGSVAGAHYTVYGRIPAAQNVPAGAYADQLVITVSY
ncbi:fimbrial major subunit CsuA/B family protein [Xylophilus rhododendri]|uniref:Fimbrial major subunit CsuA/B family protein n=1 Tax=Xylophilus rhododendri TaxID=2697032 RepID=A0A857J716_9BURK|nr:spore coat U domain-containing protein [Xylophilus rhododendri]QHI98831.1 fimbrial major subunit CsuA/B family protein [Xylophilus rhododendri]